MHALPPLTLYIHIPWCIRKCPYCDFNSYAHDGAMPVDAYVAALLNDLQQDLAFVQDRNISSIFFGGGTPSLMPSTAISKIIQGIKQQLTLTDTTEITLECNPGSAEYSDFYTLREAGINRLSFGAQSFDDQQLKTLGRIHQARDTHRAIEKAEGGHIDVI